MHGRYRTTGIEETIAFRLRDNGALCVARHITNTSGAAQVILGASAKLDGIGGPVFSDNHLWRARFCHMDNVRLEKYPWCRPEYPYVRPLPTVETVFGGQESQAAPVMMLTNDTSSQLLLEGQLEAGSYPR